LRLGILGGTFDPVHFGHLRLAEEIAEELELEKVYLIPAAAPPHKEKKPLTSFQHRLEMVRMAASASPMLEALDMEGRRQGLSYSIETLREFHRIFPDDLKLFFIIGMDAFVEIETWKDYKSLFDYADFVVVERPGISSKKLEPFLLSLGVGFRKESEHRFGAGSGNFLIYKQATLMDISSTRIREKVAGRKSIRFLVPQEVISYIEENGLYKGHEND